MRLHAPNGSKAEGGLNSKVLEDRGRSEVRGGRRRGLVRGDGRIEEVVVGTARKNLPETGGKPMTQAAKTLLGAFSLAGLWALVFGLTWLASFIERKGK